ncbi:MerR family transcriptional regulator [Amphibacillus cookii]|uniref:MerR family transcriptional regulator n=1 Tax=Amphibacillus cookii TaxID=767787 RepID=UPI00195B6CC0|nr:MerR family transcriptional regulator [Amphibacillus cookii]MBM7542321.1 DNA-binding transcriptional MerR regulator [Amphibacillus cookii]
MAYRIGEIAELFGLSKEAIRHYERLHIIKSNRNPHNNYRFYDEEAVNTLRVVRSYRSLNFSLDEIIALINTQEKKAMLNELNSKEKKLKTEIEALKQQIDIIHQQKHMLQQLDHQLGKYQIKTKPSTLWLSYNHENKKDILYKNTEYSWSKQMPSTRISARYVLNKDEITSIPGFCISSKDAEKANLDHNGYIKEFPSCKAVHTVMTSNLAFDQYIDETWINKLLQHEKEHGLQTSNEILSMGIIKIGDQYYFEIWHPLI